MDVAKKAGVSVATVSRALNGRPRIGQETKEYILKIADQLGYSLPPCRPGPRPGRPPKKKKLALLYFIEQGHAEVQAQSTFVALRREVDAEAKLYDYCVDLHVLSSDENLPEPIVSGGYRGFLLVGVRPHPSVEDFLIKQPCCWLMNNPWTPTWGDHVMPDHREVGMLAANYLLDRGCTHPAIIKLGLMDRIQSLRVEGFAYATAQRRFISNSLAARVPLQTEYVVYPEVVYVDELIEDLKKMKPWPDGFFINCDYALAALYPVMIREKLIVPGKTVLIGCDNQPQNLRGITPYPATIEVHFELIGKLGVSQIAWRIQNKEISQRVRSHISPTLISLN